MQPKNAIKGRKGFAPIPIEERFWSKVTIGADDECWLWQKLNRNNGYGQIYHNGKSRRATHVAWELYYKKPFPADKMACHKCDNPPCVNPRHIWPGTMSENICDARDKNRLNTAFGARSGSSKLTDEIVIEMRIMNLSGKYSASQIASYYGVTKGAVLPALSGKRWKHLHTGQALAENGGNDGHTG